MSVMEIRTTITHKYLMGKTKHEIAHLYMNLLREMDSDEAEISQLKAKLAEAEKDAETGRKWMADSSLETWFPYSAELIQELRAKLAEEAEKDAARYRRVRQWWLDPSDDRCLDEIVGWPSESSPSRFDAAIDTAMEQKP